jgi:hypothetical protein
MRDWKSRRPKDDLEKGIAFVLAQRNTGATFSTI